MTYALGWPLQKAVYAALMAAPAVGGALGGRIHDGAPQEAEPGAGDAVYIVLGDDSAIDFSAADMAGAGHLITIGIVAPRRSFGEAKAVAGAVCDVLLGADLALERGRVVSLSFQSAKTKREERDAIRRIDLRFRALVEDTA
jgi:hypothetical protein